MLLLRLLYWMEKTFPKLDAKKLKKTKKQIANVSATNSNNINKNKNKYRKRTLSTHGVDIPNDNIIIFRTGGKKFSIV